MRSDEGGLRAPTRNIIAWTEADYWNSEKLDEETRRQFDVCHGCRRCFNLCDSFPKLFDLIDQSKTLELDSVKSEDFKPVIDACTLCDMCFMVTCPYVPPHEFAIDIPKLMLRHRAKNFKNGNINLKEKQIAEIDRNGKLGQKIRPISNAVISLKNKPARYIIEKTLNINKKAKLPNFVKPFNESFPINKKAPAYGKKAI
ncbi:MAG TPA: (Fe-S)-binding protein, partial [Alphaproteobacteria bacterium]|nr:(Fe-S)-binding protein [Alphaproteobacteria bacterium]